MGKNQIIQIIFWIGIFFVNLVLSSEHHAGLHEILYEFLSTGVYASIFYINIYYLFPVFYEKQRIKYFAFGSLILLGGIIFLSLFVHGQDTGRNFRDRHDHLFEMVALFRSGVWMMLIFLASTIYAIQKRLNQQIKQHKQIMEEKLQTEVELLKAQINPHFLFNALNNIYSLVYMQSPRAPDSVLKLSEMLRYVVEDCCNEKVPLKKEISYIHSLIDFYQLRNPEHRDIQFTTQINNPEILIAPMIFIPFIENSFKYSRIEEDTKGFIYIDLRESGDSLLFSIRNSMFKERNILPGSGKGIENVKQRLEIIYPGKHYLTLRKDSEAFAVELKIQLV